MNSSMATRAMPSPSAACATWVQPTNWKRGSGRCDTSAPVWTRSSGMNTSVIVKSWLPVPRIPVVCHVSTYWVWDAGSTHRR